jgi:hypothetical protein
MAGCAKTWVSLGFLGVPRTEACTMNAFAHGVVEHQVLRQCRDPRAVAARAKPLEVAARAHFSVGCCAQSVLS